MIAPSIAENGSRQSELGGTFLPKFAKNFSIFQKFSKNFQKFFLTNFWKFFWHFRPGGGTFSWSIFWIILLSISAWTNRSSFSWSVSRLATISSWINPIDPPSADPYYGPSLLPISPLDQSILLQLIRFQIQPSNHFQLDQPILFQLIRFQTKHSSHFHLEQSIIFQLTRF